MNTKRSLALLLVITLALPPLMTGCQTYGESGGLGAASGALIGGVIGHQSGSAIEGALIGGALGGMAGLIAHDVKVRKQRDAQQTMEHYNYQPAQGESLLLEESFVQPQSIRLGDSFNSTIQYALMGTGAGVEVSEQRTLLQGDRVMAELSTKKFTRQDGTWSSSQSFRLPNNLQPGQYTLVTSVFTAQSKISGRANLSLQ